VYHEQKKRSCGEKSFYVTLRGRKRPWKILEREMGTGVGDGFRRRGFALGPMESLYQREGALFPEYRGEGEEGNLPKHNVYNLAK